MTDEETKGRDIMGKPHWMPGRRCLRGGAFAGMTEVYR